MVSIITIEYGKNPEEHITYLMELLTEFINFLVKVDE